MYNSKQIKSLVSKSDSLIYYNVQYINKRVIQAPQNCVLPIIFNPSGKIVFCFFFFNSVNWSDKSQKTMERKLSNILL